MTHRLLALALAIALAGGGRPAQAMEGGGVGVSYGYSLYGQGITSWEFKTVPWGPHAEVALRFIQRAQSLAPDRTYALESSGLGLGVGGKLGPVHLGVDGEAGWLKRLAVTPGAATLEYQNALAWLVEPYLALDLPFLQSEVSSLDVSLRYPLLRSDPAFGPRLMLTLWLGGNPSKKPKRHPVEAPKAGEEEESPPPAEPEAPPAPKPPRR